MKETKVGVRVRALSSENGYQANRVYVVAEVDDDNTFKGRDPKTGNVGRWVSWNHFAPASELGLEFAKKMLPPEVVSFLSAFDGLEAIELRSEFKDALIKKMPHIKDEILRLSVEIDLEDDNS